MLSIIQKKDNKSGIRILVALKNQVSFQREGCHADGPGHNDNSGDPGHSKDSP